MAYRTLCNAGVLALGLALAACEDDMESLLDASADAGDQEAGDDDAGGHEAGPGDAGHDGSPADAAPEPRSIELSFEARVGSAVFDCAQTYEQVGTSKVRVSFSDFRLYVYDVRLIDEAEQEIPLELTQDGDFQHEDVALLDFENRTGGCVNGTVETNTVVRGTLPDGNFKALRFGVGVPSALNHGDPLQAPSPLNLTAMLWTWQAGRLFTRIDTRVETSSGNRPAFLIHLGSDGCSGNPVAGQAVTCARPNRSAIELADFDPQRDKIVLDYAKLVAEVALDNDQGGESGCMAGAADPECQSIFGQLGLDPQSGAPGGDAQVVFSVEPK
jgi:uncharacterized repeat protein (TIGR04052 family)